MDVAGVGLGQSNASRIAIRSAPGLGNHQLAKMIVAVDQRRSPIGAVKLELETAVDRAQPEPVLIHVGVPLPVHRCRAFASLPAQPHEVPRRAGAHVHLEADVLDLYRGSRSDPAAAIGKAVVFQQAIHSQLHALRPRHGPPGNRSFQLAGKRDLRHLELHGSIAGLHDKPKRSGQQLARRSIRDGSIVGVKERANLLRQAGLAEDQLPAENLQRVVLPGNRQERAGDDIVIHPDLRIEPSQPRQPPGVAVAMIVERLAAHVELEVHRLCGPGGGVLHPDLALIGAGGRLRHVHTNPQRLQFALLHARSFAEGTPEKIDPAQVEAAEIGGRNCAARPGQVAKLRRQFANG